MVVGVAVACKLYTMGDCAIGTRSGCSDNIVTVESAD